MRDKYLFVPARNVDRAFDPIIAYLSAAFSDDKSIRKAESGLALRVMQAELGVRGRKVHEVLHRYEKRYLNIGDWPALLQDIMRNTDGNVELERIGNSYNVFGKIGGIKRKIGMIFLEDSRFVTTGARRVNGKDIYYRRDDPHKRHYIFVNHTRTFVRRYVSRGLNGFDAMNLARGFPLMAVLQNDQAIEKEIGGHMHAVVVNTDLTIAQQILSHTRGWGGSKRFVSTGVSNHPAISTRGYAFNSLYGAVTVDLAMVNDDLIYDLHTPRAARAQFQDPSFHASPDDVLVNAHHTTDDIAGQAYLGMRDVLRTRELLIKGNIQPSAILAVRNEAVVLGIGCSTNSEHKEVRKQFRALPRFVAHDPLDFRDPHTGKRWHFIEFATAHDATSAHAAFHATRTQDKVLFPKFSPVRPTGMV
ncbi:hypothetical protein H3V53_22825 [Paraburkholderia bengalensis]|uniref:RRM domain-containing protein n=1 Tax=Paraburkholderia bengalensis TaxID=2747562 RepID=A0ABU8IX32_9BURK